MGVLDSVTGFANASLGKLGVGMEQGKVNTSSTTSMNQTKQRVLDQNAIDKLLYDLLAQDQGLAQLASGENLAGGFNSSTKTLMAQDFLTKVLGEVALITAPEVTSGTTTQDSVQRSKKTSAKTVICTELMRQGRLPSDMYEEGHQHFLNLSPYTVSGYRLWADKVVPLMQKSPGLSNFLAPIAYDRYLMTTGRASWTFWGAVTIYVGQPVCNVIGRIYALLKGEQYGSVQSA